MPADKTSLAGIYMQHPHEFERWYKTRYGVELCPDDYNSALVAERLRLWEAARVRMMRPNVPRTVWE
jgi:hypothetical protein